MKYFYLILILLISLIICEEIVKKESEEKEEKKDKNELSNKIYDYLAGLHLDEIKIITKEELLNMIESLFTLVINEIELTQEEKESNLNLIRMFSNQIFDLLATKEKNVIEIDKILDYFNPKNISKYIDLILKALGLNDLYESIVKPLLSIFETIFLNNEKNAEL
jgi:hypothetical protein